MRSSIEKLSEQIRNQPHLDESEKEELLALLSEIEEETHDATPEKASPAKDLVRLTAEGVEKQSIPGQWEESLLRLEATYPRTAAALGRIGHVLSRMGI